MSIYIAHRRKIPLMRWTHTAGRTLVRPASLSEQECFQ